MAHPKAAIFGLKGITLSDDEKRFFASVNPLGYILFARNCETTDQVKALTAALREIAERDIPILIDQEGGRVARLKPPHWRKSPPAMLFADYAVDASADVAASAVYANARLIAQELHTLGINVDCAPLADVPVADAHDIIGDRAFGTEPMQVAKLSGAMARGLIDGGVLPVLKHIPGHGRARADSHEELPAVHESLDVLRKTDFIPFKQLAHLPMGMTAHILYTAIDAELPATLSRKVMHIIREEIGFDGLVMSDDLSMKALGGSFEERTRMSLSAGCDTVLHCNGNSDEMQAIARALSPLDDKGAERFARAWAQLKAPTAFAYEEAKASVSSISERYAKKTG